MKVNREQFLAAAFLFAATTGCGKVTDKMRETMGVGPDPAAQNQPVQGAGLGIDPNTVNTPSGQPQGVGHPVNAKQPAPPAPKLATKHAGPANEGVGPANENVGPSKESVGPSKENFGPSNEWGPSREWGPSAENRRRRGPANENWGPADEKWPRPVPTSSGKAPLPPKPKRG
jgi:hypothetical protein